MYKNRLETTVLGAFEWKTSKKVKYAEPIYPRFKSYYNESRFKDIKDEGIFYQGGFSMEGKRVNSSSVFGGKGIIKLKNKNNKYYQELKKHKLMQGIQILKKNQALIMIEFYLMQMFPNQEEERNLKPRLQFQLIPNY
jgi:hypothetical protein